MKIIDTHAHLNRLEYKDAYDEVFKRTEENLECIINVGYDRVNSKENVDLSKAYPFIYASVGIHPNSAYLYNDEVENEFISYFMNNDAKVVAIGEIGLDYYREHARIDMQKSVFRSQLRLCSDMSKLVIVHCRDAFEDTFDILNEHKDVVGVMHSFTGTLSEAMRLIDRFYISINGLVTFKNAVNIKDLAKNLPLDRLLLETDSPYLAPVPYRGARNEPSHIEYVAKELAKLRDMPIDELIAAVNKNAREIFKI